MKSRITIEVDFQNNSQPVIQILYRKSEDVRDNLIHYFLELLGGQSRWCTINWEQDHDNPLNPEERFSRIFIRPVKAEQFEHERKLLDAIIKQNNLADRNALTQEKHFDRS